MRLSAVQLVRREQNKAKLAKNIQFNYQIKIKICIFAKIYYGWFYKLTFLLTNLMGWFKIRLLFV